MPLGFKIKGTPRYMALTWVLILVHAVTGMHPFLPLLTCKVDIMEQLGKQYRNSPGFNDDAVPNDHNQWLYRVSKGSSGHPTG